MTLAIPPAVLVQAFVALLAGGLATYFGIWAMHRSWRHHDARAERDFILGLIVHLVGLSWVVLGGAIIVGMNVTGEAAGNAVQDVVVFTNAAVRISVLLLAGHFIWDRIRAHREVSE